MKNTFPIIITIFSIIALVLGYIIFQQRTPRNTKNLPMPISSPEEIPDISSETSIKETPEGEFTIFISESTEIFGIAQDNPYYGEPPASTGLGNDGESQSSSTSFEVFGDVISLDVTNNSVRISSDYPKPISTPFTPRGPRVSFRDIKEGDFIVISSLYNENREVDYRNVQFVQISPSREEIKFLRDAQDK